MITGGTGGANTLTGLIFEGKVDLKTFLNQQSGYKVMGSHVFYLNVEVGQIFKKHELYSQFLEPRGIDWRNCIYANYFLIMESMLLLTIPFTSLKLKLKMLVEALMRNYRHAILRRGNIRSYSFP